MKNTSENLLFCFAVFVVLISMSNSLKDLKETEKERLILEKRRLSIEEVRIGWEGWCEFDLKKGYKNDKYGCWEQEELNEK